MNDLIRMSNKKIIEWYEYWEGSVAIAVSGIDSTVLADLVNKVFPNVPRVFVNTSQEFPEIIRFQKEKESLIIKPQHKGKTISYRDIVETKYGYPVISKVVSMGISRYRKTKSEQQRNLRLFGGINSTSGKKQLASIPKRYHFLVNAPFLISDECCRILKKQPLIRYQKDTGRKFYIGVKATDSNQRKIQYLKHGCNAYDLKYPASRPLSFWTDQDIWRYVKEFNLSYPKIYDMGYKNTGCAGCMFGIMKEEKDRFAILKTTHPKLWNYYMVDLGQQKIMEYIKSNIAQ